MRYNLGSGASECFMLESKPHANVVVVENGMWLFSWVPAAQMLGHCYPCVTHSMQLCLTCTQQPYLPFVWVV